MTPRSTATGRVDGQVQRVNRLAAEAAAAARVRELTTHPDVIALRVERVRAQVDGLLWAGIVLGLAFTMVNVQAFAADGAGPDSPAWWVAWLLDPMVSLVLLAVLRAEQVTARYQVTLPAWARRTKWLTFAATYVMNTWTSWGLDSGAGAGAVSWSGVVLHSVPPLVVFATAETGPGLRDRLTEAVHRALLEHQSAQADAPQLPAALALPDGIAQDAQLDLDEADPEVPHGEVSDGEVSDGDVVDRDVPGEDLEEDPVELGLVDEHGLSRSWETAPPALLLAERDTPADRAAALIADGAGRRRLARGLGISEYEARQLLARTRETGRTGEDGPDEPAGATGPQEEVRPERVHALNGAGTNGAGTNGTSYGTAGGTA